VNNLSRVAPENEAAGSGTPYPGLGDFLCALYTLILFDMGPHTICTGDLEKSHPAQEGGPREGHWSRSEAGFTANAR